MESSSRKADTDGGQDPGAAPGPSTGTLEELLLSETSVTPGQIARARRISGRLREPKPISEILVELGQLTRSEHERIARSYRSRLTLAEILREEGALDDEGMSRYWRIRSEDPSRSEISILVGDGLVPEDAFIRAVCAKHDIPYLEPEADILDVRLLSRVSVPYLRRHRVLPFRMVEDVLTVVMADPLDNSLIEELARIYDAPIRPCGAPASAILSALEQVHIRSRMPESEDDVATTLNYREIHRADDSDEIGAEAVRIVDHVLYRAISLGASDVHIEPQLRQVVVRVRIDGVLQRLTELPADFAPRIAARVKVLCAADLAERRHHQDGRIFVKVDNREIDLRVSIYASVYGETVVIRVLDRGRGLIPLEGLGFEAGTLRAVREVALRSPSGLVLVTGPTGSGKTTTLYSFIDSLLDGKLKVITCEDPVEYVLEGTTQCSVNHKGGPDFPDSLRAMIRQDPDIIVIGEIRDRTTASMSVEAALTGHKVLTSFHTEDAVSAVIRLLEMGIEPFLVASTLGCIVAQRLVRRLCPHCMKTASASKRDLRYFGLTVESLDGLRLHAPAGCAECDGIGFKGRLGVHEVLAPDDDFRDAVLGRAPSKELRRLARRLPTFLSLQEDGLLKVAAGLTSLGELADEVPRDLDCRKLSVIREIALRRSA